MCPQLFVASSPVDESPTAATRPLPYVDVANVTPLLLPAATVVFQTCPFALPLNVIDDDPNSPSPRDDKGTPYEPV